MISKGLRFLLIAGLIFTTLLSPAFAKTKKHHAETKKHHHAQAIKVPDNQVIARWCRLAYYDYDAVHKADHSAKFDANGQTRHQKTALVYLTSIPKPILKKRLMQLIKASHTGAYTYDGAAFVLAYNGIDVNPNTRRVVTGWKKHWDGEDGDPIGEDVTSNLLILARRFPREATFGALFFLRCDGRTAEAKYLCVQDLMKAKPKVMLRFVGKRGDGHVAKLAQMLQFEGTPKYVRPLLKRLRKDKDPLVAKTAARLAKSMAK